MKKLFVLLIITTLIFTGCSKSTTSNKNTNTERTIASSTNENTIAESTVFNTNGNTGGNLAAKGFVAQQGDWIYYTNNTEAIYKMKTNGTGKVKLSDAKSVYDINVVGDWIYYIDYESTLDISICKMKTDGTDTVKLLSANDLCFLNVVGDWIYYTSKDELYKMKIDGTGKAKLSNDVVSIINIVGDWNYYTSYNYGLYKMKTDGTNNIDLNDDNHVENINVVGDWIYYTKFDDSLGFYQIYKIKTDGTGNIKLSDNQKNQIPCINVVDDWIYYTSINDHSKEQEDYNNNDTLKPVPENFATLYKMKTDGTEKTKLEDKCDSFINIIGGWIYYSIGESSNDGLYKIKTDGTGKQLIEK